MRAPLTVPLASGYRLNSRSLGASTDPNLSFEYFPIGDDDEGSGWMKFTDAPSRARRLAKEGDVIYSTVRPLLDRCFVADDNPAAVYSTGYAVIESKEGWSSRFLYHWLFSHDARRQIYGRCTGSNYPAISCTDLSNIEIPNIAFGTQQKIADILDDWDHALTRAEKLATKRKTRLTWLASHLAFEQDIWRPIGKIAKQISARAGQNFEDFDVFSCTKHDGLVLSEEYFSKQVYGEDRTDYKVIQPLELAYATNHLEEGSIGLNTHGRAGIVSPMYTVFQATDIDPEFLISVLKTERMRREFERRTPASVNRRGGLRWGDFSEIEVPFPDPAKQKSIISMLRVAQVEVDVSEALVSFLRRQKRALLKYLLNHYSGRSERDDCSHIVYKNERYSGFAR